MICRKTLIGQRHYKLICIQELSGGRVLVRCDCGIEKNIKRHDFFKTKTCGCSKHKYDVIGKKFGKLKVLKFNKILKKYECICKCGNIRFNLGKDLYNNMVESCGCKREKNREIKRKKWIGKKIGKYTVTKYLGLRPKFKNSKKLISFYEITCECGSVREKKISHLCDAESCGCSRKDSEYLKKMMIDFKRTKKIKTIRTLGKSYKVEELSEMFDLSTQSIRRILDKKTYKWVEDGED